MDLNLRLSKGSNNNQGSKPGFPKSGLIDLSNFGKPMPSIQPSPLPAALPKSRFKFDSKKPSPPPKDLEQKPKTDTGFKLVDVRGGKKYRDSAIYRKDFRYKTAKELKRFMKRSKDRWAVSDMLWKARGKGGISFDEVKRGLYRLEDEDRLNRPQVKMLRKKLGVYKSSIL